jgi:hypothetical protein
MPTDDFDVTDDEDGWKVENQRVFSASLRCRGYLVYFLEALARRRAGKSIWLTLSMEKAIGSKS